MHQPARHLSGGRQDERVAARRARLDQSEHGIVDLDELAELGEVPAYQCEVVPVVEAADLPDPIQPGTVTQLASEGEARIRGVGDQPAAPDQIDDLPEQTPLRVVRVHVVVLRHTPEPTIWPGRRPWGQIVGSGVWRIRPG